MSRAPYAGVRLDAAIHIGDYGREVEKWERLLGSERIQEYNRGIDALLSTANQTVSVLCNGIAPVAIRGPGRDLFILEFTDGAIDENFCIDGRGRSNTSWRTSPSWSATRRRASTCGRGRAALRTLTCRGSVDSVSGVS
jgi:hypothetical protein